MLELTDVLAESFDIVKGLLLGDEAKVLFLKRKGTTESFEDVVEVTAGWRSRYSEFFGTTTFDIADVTQEFTTSMSKATHLVVKDTGLVGMNNGLYEMQPETAAPDSDHPYWRVRARSLGRKYVSGQEA